MVYDSYSSLIPYFQEELGVPYEIKKYQRAPDMRAPEELKAVNPLGTAPVITDGGNNLAESGAIVGTSFYRRCPPMHWLRCTSARTVYYGVRKSWTTRLRSTSVADGTQSEYIIRKYANGRARVPASGELSDLYCTCHGCLDRVLPALR